MLTALRTSARGRRIEQEVGLTRRRAHPLLLFGLLGLALVVASCSGASRHARAPQPAPPRAESLYEQYKRVTAVTCSPHKRSDALAYGDVPLCAPFDSIPAVDRPRFVAASRASFLPAAEPVVALDLGSEHRAYPVRFLIFHEIVNDTVAGRPIVVSFCPLCNSAVAHSRRVAGRTLSFGVSGQLRGANLIMFDRQTLTMWQQMTGVALVGPLAGKRLAQLPVTLVSFGSWRAAHPSGQVMRPPARYGFSYGTDPYANYDSDPNRPSPVLSAEPTDPRLPPKWRVVGVATERGSVAFPVPRRAGTAAVERALLGPVPLVAFFSYGAAQAEKRLHLAAAPRGWSGTVWVSELDGRVLHFAARRGGFVETTTGSRFDLFGRAVSGPLAGARLTPAPQETAFWFAWSYFHPRTAIARGP